MALNFTSNVIQLNDVDTKALSGKRIWFEDFEFSGNEYNKSIPPNYFTDVNAGGASGSESGVTASSPFRFFSTYKTGKSLSSLIASGAKYVYVMTGCFYKQSEQKYQISTQLSPVVPAKKNSSNKWEAAMDTGYGLISINDGFKYGIKIINALAKDSNVVTGFDIDLVEMVLDLQYFANKGATTLFCAYPKNEVVNTLIEKPRVYFICEADD